MSEERKRKLVVAGLIVAPDRRMLITQRRADQSLPLQWEFPGGKVEPGEAPVDALVRELYEEVGIHVEVGPIWEVLFHAYRDFDLVMLVYQCQLRRDSPGPRPKEVADLAWAAAMEMREFDILPADKPLVDRLVKEGPP